MKRKRLLILMLILIVIILIITKMKKENIINKEENEIDKILSNQGLKSNPNIYIISKEYDGREIIEIKPSIKYRVAFTGIIKNELPDLNSLEEINKLKNGVWISENSRKVFIEKLNNFVNGKYHIDENGYLVIDEASKDKYGLKLKEMISGKNLYIFDINSIFYTVDDATGDITEYPFEDMDPLEPYECIEYEDKKIYVISTNKFGKLNYNQIFENLLDNIN